MSGLGHALYPGTFDLLTNGHWDLIRRGAALFERLTVAVAKNDGKDPLFSTEERVAFLKAATADLANVSIDAFDGLTVDYARQIGAGAIIRGLRFVGDLEYELQMALHNRAMAPEIETLFLAPSVDYSFLSSTLVREIAARGGDVSAYVPAAMSEALLRRFGSPETP